MLREHRGWVSEFTSTRALGSNSARNSCSIESMMFFQPSRRMSPCRWARLNTVLAATWALGLLPNTEGRLSMDCSGWRGHYQSDSTSKPPDQYSQRIRRQGPVAV